MLGEVLVRWIICCLAALAVSSPALASNASTGLQAFDGVQVIPTCSRSPGGSSEFQFVVVNRRPTTVGSERLDVYFTRGIRLTPVPGYHDPQETTRIVGRHAWETAPSLNLYSGFALQPIVHVLSVGTPKRAAFVLTVEGKHHAFATWTCEDD
jgi:hypothetical protein